VSRLVVFSSKPPDELRRLLDHLQRELTDARVCGVLYQKRAQGTAAQRMRVLFRKLLEPGYLRYATREAFRRTLSYLSIPIDATIRFLHACPRKPNPPVAITLSDLSHHLQRHGCELFVTPDAWSPAALAFVERQEADLGLVFGPGLLNPALVKIPRLGSIGLNLRQVPEDRGGGLAGRWEPPDKRSEITVAVRKVDEAPDKQPILRQGTMPIDRYDDLQSLALKAEVVGHDLVVAAIADCVAGEPLPRLQIKECKPGHPSVQDMLTAERELLERRPRYSPKRTRPVWKLLFRSIFLLPFAVVRNWLYRWRKAFPIVIFYHHVISDRPHHLGTPTAAFARQIAFLRKFYRIASLEQAMQMLRIGSVPVPTLVLTFDDGYADNFVNLRAVAEHYNIPVFLFLSTAHIESGSPFGHDIKRKQTGFAPLSWDQVKSLSRSGFSFGCHTRSHFDCGSDDMTKLEDEIAGSKRDLGSRAEIWADYFSFPWGMPENISSEALRLAKASFPYVFAAAGGVNVVGNDPGGALLCREDHPGSLWEVELSAQCLLNVRTWRDLFTNIF
jgi:peptidoglycan/xylan/chitin deacetylase (PgdA/CDA1 family)/folate-dependent phosphoribosylglycinamide formyltransferase PurN